MGPVRLASGFSPAEAARRPPPLCAECRLWASGPGTALRPNQQALTDRSLLHPTEASVSDMRSFQGDWRPEAACWTWKGCAGSGGLGSGFQYGNRCRRRSAGVARCMSGSR